MVKIRACAMSRATTSGPVKLTRVLTGSADSWVSGLGIDDPQQRDGMRSVLMRASEIRRPLMRVAGVV